MVGNAGRAVHAPSSHARYVTARRGSGRLRLHEGLFDREVLPRGHGRKDLRGHVGICSSRRSRNRSPATFKTEGKQEYGAVAFVNRLIFANRKQLRRTSWHRKRTCTRSFQRRYVHIERRSHKNHARLTTPFQEAPMPFKYVSCDRKRVAVEI